MIKAVFFDWFQTLVYSKPGRHEIYQRAYSEKGIQLDPDIFRGAENELPDGNPVKWRRGENSRTYIGYQEVLLREAGISLPRDTILGLVKRINGIAKKVTLALHDDVIPTFNVLKKRGLILGLLTNVKGACILPIESWAWRDT